MLRHFLAFDRGLDRAGTISAQLLLAAAAFFAFYQVLTRFLFQAPSDWTEVLTRTLIVWMVYLGIGIAFREGAMVSIDVLRNACNARTRGILEASIALAVALFLTVAAWYGAQVAWAVRFQTLAGLDISIGWAYLAVPVGALAAISGVIAHLLDPVRRELEHAV